MPLSGIRVLELGRMLAAPLTGQLLGDLGAEVVKIEQRGEGDYFRRYGLIAVKDANGNRTAESAAYTSANRNKRSIAVDLAHADGAELVRKLASECDVFIENFKVGGLAKYGLDHSSIASANPKVIYLSVSGFGLPQGVFVWMLRPVGVPDEASFALSTLIIVTGLAGNIPGLLLWLRQDREIL